MNSLVAQMVYFDRDPTEEEAKIFRDLCDIYLSKHLISYATHKMLLQHIQDKLDGIK